MQSILSILKSRYFWISIGVSALIALTLVLGWWLGWSLVTQLSVVIGLLVVCIVLIAYKLVRASRSAQQIEESIKMQAEQQRMSSRPDKQAEIKELQERLEEAIATLKESKLGRDGWGGWGGDTALHALPWYMFIGPPGAGKTTAIRNSGLNFPVGTDSVQGVGGTRNCDWFFTDQAILLDTAGRYMTEKEDEEEWHAFLDMLKEHRTGRPINGVLIGISIEKLADASPDDIQWHANNIRRRTSELVEQLGVRFPVYLVFTKCDLLQGFVEFFGDMTREEREQIWGCTFTEEQRKEGDPRSLFEQEFDRLYDALIDVRAERLRRSMKREDRRKVYTFPLQFSSAKESLSLFVDQLFQQNPYQENPEFRGFYFTSGTQEGAPIDHVIQSVSEQFDLATGAEARTEPETEAKSYFLKDLFTEVVIPDQYLVEQTSSAARRRRLVQWGVGAAVAIALGVVLVGLSQAFVRSQWNLGQWEDTAQKAAAVQWDGRNTAEDLERIGELRNLVTELEQADEEFQFLQGGLQRAGTVLGPTRSLYYQSMRPLIRDQFEALQTRLADAQAPTEEERSALRTGLENYLLLSDSSHALEQPRYRQQLIEHLIGGLTQSNPATTVSFAGRGNQIEPHVQAYVEGLRNDRVDPFQAQSTLAEDITRMVCRPPTIENIYRQIKERGTTRLAPLSLADLLSDRRGRFSHFEGPSQVSVPGFFTKRGWNNFVQEQIKQAAETPDRGRLIGGCSDQFDETLPSSEDVEEQLRDRYFGEYATAWKQFLGRIQYQSFGSLRETAQALQTLGDPVNSPLIYVLGKVTNETQFESRLDAAKEEVADEATEAAEKTARRKTGVRETVPGGEEEDPHPVNSQMRALHRLNADRAQSGEGSPALVQALKVLRTVGVKLDGMRNDRRQVYDFAKQILDENGGMLDQQMVSLRDQLSGFFPQPRRELFEQPILDGWSTVLANAQNHLNERWDQQVYGPYQADLQGRYPLSESAQDVPQSTFQEFFRPRDGILDAFYQNHLSSFLREDRSRAKTWEGRGLQLSSATLEALDRADQLRGTLFQGGFGLQFTLTPYVPEHSGDAPAPGGMLIRIHGSELEYNMGKLREDKDFTWPGSSRGAEVRIRTDQGILQKQFEGAWALFRMLEAADVDTESPTDYRIQWRFSPTDRYSLTAICTLYSENPTMVYADPGEVLRFRLPATLN